MTLFKKVFGNHAVGSPNAPIPSEGDEEFALSDASAEDIVAKLARATGGDDSVMPATDEVEEFDDLVSEETMMPDSELPEIPELPELE